MIDYTDPYLYNLANLFNTNKQTSYSILTKIDPDTIVDTLHYHLLNKCTITYTTQTICKCFEYETTVYLTILWH